MAQRAASYGEAVLHKTPDDEALFRFTSQYEAAPLHSAMKHSLRSYDEKMENGSFRLQYIPCSVILTVERKTPMEKTSNKLVNLSVAFAVEILNIASVNTAKQNIKKVQ